MRLRALVATVALMGAMLVGAATPALAWTGWAELPGGGSTPSGPAVVPGTGEVFVRGTDDRIYWNVRSGGGWSGWGEVPGNGRAKSAPAAVRTSGILWIAVRGTDDYLYLQKKDSNGWSGWFRATVKVGADHQTLSRPALADTGAGEPGVYIRGKSDNRIYKYHFDGFITPSQWNEVPGGMTTGNGPGVHGRSSGTVRDYLFVSGTNNRIYYDIRNDNGEWDGWREFGGNGLTIDSPAVSGDSIGNITVFVRGTDNYVYQSRGGWSVVNTGRQTSGPPSAAYTSYGHCVFIRGYGSDQRIYYSCQ